MVSSHNISLLCRLQRQQFSKENNLDGGVFFGREARSRLARYIGARGLDA